MGIGFLAFQLLFLDPFDRAISWDEAVYVSQVSPGTTLPFVASRARGITFLIAPVTGLGASLAVVRVYLALLSAAALIGAFSVWLPVAGRATPIAAFVFASSWIALFYGSEIMPNVWSALLAVAAAGYLARSIGPRVSRRDVVAGAALLAVLALFRPPDSLPVLAAFAVALVGTGEMIRRLAPAVAGVALGWLPWLVEMSVRFGGPVDGLRLATDAAHVSSGGAAERIVQHLALTNGPTLGPAQDPSIAWGGVAWWAGTVVAVAIGVLAVRGTAAARPALLAATGGLLLALGYLLLVQGTAPRFLLPAHALLAIPASIGIRHVASRVTGRPARMALAGLLLVPWLLWQMGTADRLEAQTDLGRQSLKVVGLALRGEAQGRACAFASTDGYPQIQYAGSCVGSRLTGEDGTGLERLHALADRGYRTFVVVRSPADPPAGLEASAPILTLPAPQGERWLVYDASSAST